MKVSYESVNEFLDDLHAEVSIKEFVIDQGLIEKKAFRGDMTKCIFHDGDNTPSMQVKDEFWKCYACNAKGDLVSFIQMHYNVDFIEAIRKIASDLNINIDKVKYKFDGKANELKEEWEKFQDNLTNASKEIQALQADYFPQQIGYDSVHNYIVFPFTSKTGAILGFTKRRINDESESPKWIHSTLRDSLMSHCHNIFNLHTASPEIKKQQEVVISEGPKDVIGWQRIGKQNSVCVCGTNNAANVWDLLLPVKRVVISMDGDNPGINAALHLITHLADLVDVKNITVVEMPRGEDPYSVANLQELYEHRIPAVSFMAKHGDAEAVLDTYNKVPAFNKQYFMKELCKEKNFTIEEARSWMEFGSKDAKPSNLSVEEREKTKLLAILEGRDFEGPYVDPEKAKRILYLKYGMRPRV